MSAEYTTAATKAKLFGSETDSLKAKAESLTQKITVQKNIVQLNSEQQEKLTKKLSDQKTKQEELKTKIDAAKEAYEKSTAETGKNSEQDKKDIDDTIQNSLLASAEKILESVQDYFNRAEALYSSMYLDCDGETPYLRTVTPVFIDGATPQVRNANEGVDFDGGTPTSRQLAV